MVELVNHLTNLDQHVFWRSVLCWSIFPHSMWKSSHFDIFSSQIVWLICSDLFLPFLMFFSRWNLEKLHNYLSWLFSYFSLTFHAQLFSKVTCLILNLFFFLETDHRLMFDKGLPMKISSNWILEIWIIINFSASFNMDHNY